MRNVYFGRQLFLMESCFAETPYQRLLLVSMPFEHLGLSFDKTRCTNVGNQAQACMRSALEMLMY